MEFHDDTDLSKTGYINIAKEKPNRPINLKWLNFIGIVLIVFALMTAVAGFVERYATMGCAAAAGLIVAWCGIAFLWQSHRQMKDKIDALTTIIEKNPKSSKEIAEEMRKLREQD